MIRILIVEDQALLRDSLANTINAQEDMKVVGAIANADEALARCREIVPDLALIDVVTDNKANGISSAAVIRREMPQIKVVIMTALPEISFMEAAKNAGVHSFIYKNAGSEHLLYVIRSTMKGHGIYPGPGDGSLVKLRFTEDEMAVIRLVCQGYKRNELVQALAMSEGTVKALISSILHKTGFNSITKFSIYAVAHGFVVPKHTS